MRCKLNFANWRAKRGKIVVLSILQSTSFQMTSGGRVTIVQSRDELMKVVDGASRTFVLFTGSKLPDGSSWCPDCNSAEPIIRKALDKVPDVKLIECHVGLRPEWKDSNCVFRREFNLTAIPTLVDWKNPTKRLIEAQCADSSLVEMMFED